MKECCSLTSFSNKSTELHNLEIVMQFTFVTHPLLTAGEDELKLFTFYLNQLQDGYHNQPTLKTYK